MESTRQLAAIMFTDIVGYTSIMGSNETRAMELVRKNREVQKPLVEKYGGTWLKELGDGAMSSFPTADSENTMCYGKKIYFFNSRTSLSAALSWFEAEHICNTNGRDLLTLQSASELDTILAMSDTLVLQNKRAGILFNGILFIRGSNSTKVSRGDLNIKMIYMAFCSPNIDHCIQTFMFDLTVFKRTVSL